MTKIADQRVELKVPVEENYVGVVRLLISGLSTRLGLPIDEIEDMKLMVGEAFLAIVHKAEQTAGLIHLNWKQTADQVTISLSDPTGRHHSTMKAASLALVQQLGGEVSSSVVDGVEHVDLDFRLEYRQDRPSVFGDRGPGRA
jgi:serine/threonine-protein kinase RsbW